MHTAYDCHSVFFRVVVCPVGVPVCQRLQHHPSRIIIPVLKIGDLCLIHRAFQVTVAVIFIVGDAFIHVDDV